MAIVFKQQPFLNVTFEIFGAKNCPLQTTNLFYRGKRPACAPLPPNAYVKIQDFNVIPRKTVHLVVFFHAFGVLTPAQPTYIFKICHKKFFLVYNGYDKSFTVSVPRNLPD